MGDLLSYSKKKIMVHRDAINGLIILHFSERKKHNSIASERKKT